ncbi:MAG TPA: signal peptide peptidase SppA [Xanthobacteraceae bacterium]|nr:signal peptide peptidase SppA [Xanthobacteraceae bacterium]
MSMDADAIVDRRRLRRKLTTWRVAAFLLALLAILGALYAVYGRDIAMAGRPGAYIARVKIQGLIRGDAERVEALDRLARSRARAVIVHVDSPGGTTAGSEQLHDALRRVASQKPMVVVVDSLAASGGYIAALAGDHIVAQGTSLVGSIGVLFQYPNVAELMKTLGVKVEEIKSSPLKAAPSAFEPTSPEARNAVEALVKDSYAWFRGLVATRRQLEGEGLDRVADGRVFTGRQAVELKLIDQLGDEKTAIAWLAKERGIDEKTQVRDWPLKDRFSDLSFLHLGAVAVLDALGLKALSERFATAGTVQAIERLNLDGLLALWHPASTN